ncbi:MAG: HDIG domain-containing protein [Planctomycetaceae bacterium]|nr:HDIG domain-containing protein [Planctomycetaceae bacterium]
MQDYQVLTLLIIGLLAVVTLTVAVQPWQAPFHYREGQVSADGVLARVDFRIENVLATRQARAEAEASASPVFVQSNTVLDELTAAFRSDLSIIANEENLSEIPGDIMAAFQLGREIPGDVEKGTSPTTRFDQVRLAMTESSMPIGERVDLMVEEFSQLLSKARLVGILDDKAREAAANGGVTLQPQQRIELVDSLGEPISYSLVVDVTLKDQLLDTGRFGKAWTSLQNLQQIRPAVETWLTGRLKGQLSFDPITTEARRREAAERVEAQYDAFASGRVLVPPGTRIAEEHLQVLIHEHEAYEAQVSTRQRLTRIGGSALLLTMMVILFAIYIGREEKQLLQEPGQLVAFVLMCSATVFLGCICSQDPWRAEVLPLLSTVVIVAIVHNQVLAILTAFSLALLISLSTIADLSHFTVLMVLCFTVIIPLRSVSSRLTLIKLGFILAGTAFCAVWGIGLINADQLSDTWKDPALLLVAGKFAFWSLVCCYLVGGSLPFIESAFGIVTDISLLELTDVSHTLLQELARRAPGTYNHSISVATIGEAAADAIGANGLLLRVGAYFHDIGKMLKPEYFIENMVAGTPSPHTNLAPAMSALIIIGHVKDGIEMAEQHGLPRRLIDFIEQHHGTTLVEYFYREAANRADEDHRTDAEESTFRYPGRRPQTKETGVMMLSDAVESASRTLSEPTPRRIQSLVREITLKRVLDGQFDECGLTMSELRVVQESLVKSLLAVHHGRIKYPDQKTA